MEKRLVTSALPYVNNVPHLGNLVQVLSADVFARYCWMRGYETLYICGTDEYGTATETKAYLESVEPQTLCDTYYAKHAAIYEWFQIGFSHFGRTSHPTHTKITQDIFQHLYDAGLIYEEEITQLYSEKTQRFLADRYVIGTCPHCSYELARGDQCEQCGTLLDPMELLHPQSAIDKSVPVPKKTKHLYLDLPKLVPDLSEFLEKNKTKWSHNAVSMTHALLRDGLKARAITRDLRWGIPVPLEGYESKVFYVWFDAPIGYISITAQHQEDWQSWWLHADDVKLFQFVGKDNIPFHTALFPAMLIGTQQGWTQLHAISSTEYMNYEGGMFSKSRNIGIFADDAQKSTIPAAVWRFYLMYNRPEKSDYNFSWDNFRQVINTELIGNIANFVNRVLSFISRYYDGVMNINGVEEDFAQEMQKRTKTISDLFEAIELRQVLREILALSDYANRLFQHREPWNMRKANPEEAHNFISMLVYLVRDLAICIAPFMPDIANDIAVFLGLAQLRWDMIGVYTGITQVHKPKVLFSFLEESLIDSLRKQFSGDQAAPENIADTFCKTVHLSAAKIVTVESHPNADKLYVLRLAIGQEERTIVSGLVGHYTPEELVGKTIIVVCNLKAAKIRGLVSNGMLLAAHNDKALEVLFLDSEGGEEDLTISGRETQEERAQSVSIDTFHNFPLCINQDGQLVIDHVPILYRGSPVQAKTLRNCGVE